MGAHRWSNSSFEEWLAAGSLGASGGLAALAVAGLTEAPPVLAAVSAAGAGLLVHTFGKVTDHMALRWPGDDERGPGDGDGG